MIERGWIMGFYEEIAKYYDDIFPIGEEQVNFINEIAEKPCTNILDIACGTGGYSIALAQKSHHLVSLDLDEKMIETVKRKSKEQNLNIKVIKANMLELFQIKEKFDLIFCIGNSVVHLQNQEEISKFILGGKNLLKDDGKLIIQIINYDRIIKNNIKSLPTIENIKIPLKFKRLYDYNKNDKKINFKTILNVEGKEIKNQIQLYPLLSNDLVKIIEELGFKNIDLYGDFKKTPYHSNESYMLVLVAGK